MIADPIPDFGGPKWSSRLLALTLAVSLLMTFLSLSSHLWDRYRVVRDVQNFYWMARAHDPTLFATDYIYIVGKQLIEVNVLGFPVLLLPVSLGYSLLFYLASSAIDYIWLSKWFVFVLMPLCVIYLFKIGKRVGGNLTAVSLSLLFAFFILASPLSISIASGVQRALAVPLMIVFVYYMSNEQYVGAGLTILIGALTYLPDLPLMTLAYALALVKVKRPFKLSWAITRAKVMPLVGSLLLSALVVALALVAQFELLAPAMTTASLPDIGGDVPVSQDPRYRPGGYAPMFFAFPFLGRAGLFDTGGDVINFLVLLVFGFFIYRIVGPRSLRRLPGICWRLLVASAIMYVVSLFFVFGLSSLALYLPSRYSRVTLFLLTLCFVGLNWCDFLEKAPNWFRRNARLLIFFAGSLSLALVGTYLLFPTRLLLLPLLLFMGLILSGILAVLGGSSPFWLAKGRGRLGGAARFVTPLAVGVITAFLGTVYIRTLDIETTNPSDPERDIYEFVETLPKDAMLAGNPDIMTNIPLFSKRSVLFRELHPRNGIAILDFFDAQYAESAEAVLDFCQRYDVSYLVLDTTDFTLDYLAKGDFFYQPYNDKIAEMVAGRTNFVLPRVQPVFVSGPFVVIKCDTETVLAGS
jgi:hypothetical protein